MTNEQADDVSDEWGDELDALDDGETEDSKDANRDNGTSDASQAVDTQSAWDVESIRDAWNPNSVRLPDSLQRRFNAYHSRIESEFALEGVESDYGKDRQYKPLVIALGLRELDAMDTSDVVDALEDLERTGHLEA